MQWTHNEPKPYSPISGRQRAEPRRLSKDAVKVDNG